MGLFSKISEVLAPDDGLDKLSPRELDKLETEIYRKKKEPQLRAEEKRLGTVDYATMPFYTMLNRSLDRYYESQRPRHLREARSLGIENPDKMSTDKLKWAVFDEKQRRYKIRKIRGSR